MREQGESLLPLSAVKAGRHGQDLNLRRDQGRSISEVCKEWAYVRLGRIRDRRLDCLDYFTHGRLNMSPAL